MKFLPVLFWCFAISAAHAQERVSLDTAMAGLEGTEVAAEGRIGVIVDSTIYFEADFGPTFILDMAVPRDDLERAEACFVREVYGPTCPARIAGVLRLNDSDIRVLVESVEFTE